MGSSNQISNLKIELYYHSLKSMETKYPDILVDRLQKCFQMET